MLEQDLIRNVGLTEGEAKVYLALLRAGSSSTGPLIKRTGVARSFIYSILDKLIEKGLVSYIEKEHKKFYEANDPEKLVEYIEQREKDLEEGKTHIIQSLPQLKKLKGSANTTEIRVFEGFKGLQTAFEKYHKKLKKGDEILALGCYPYQEDKYHEYWQKDHVVRDKEKIINRMLFNRGTDSSILANRNSFTTCEARYMESDIQTPAWILIYNNVSQIFLQDKKPIVLEIINKPIADTFRAYFEDYWGKSKPFREN